MKTQINRFIAQMEEGIGIGKKALVKPHDQEINKIVIFGMGGSGIGGDFVASFLYREASVPVFISKDYDAPGFVDKHTLLLVSSYSGNTEETLEALETCIVKGAKIICITSGGKLLAIADQNELDRILVPANWPSPRACLGYSVIAQLYAVHKSGLIDESLLKEVQSSVALLKSEQDKIQREALAIAERLVGKIPVIYGSTRINPVLVRFRQQLNENAKMLAWQHTIPEMNHNELVGWTEKQGQLAVVILRNDDDHPKVQKRIDINKEVLIKYVDTMIEIRSKGKNLIEKSFYLVHLVDWVSWFLADLRDVDANEIRVIDYLKEQLAN